MTVDQDGIAEKFRLAKMACLLIHGKEPIIYRLNTQTITSAEWRDWGRHEGYVTYLWRDLPLMFDQSMEVGDVEGLP